MWPRALALASLVLVCVVALVPAYKLRQPDPFAYRASIAALLDGRLVLDTAQYRSLDSRLKKVDDGWHSNIGIVQWTTTPSGAHVSEKNPGYAWWAAPFAAVGVVRLAPVAALLIGCAGLWLAGRRWLGEWGGAFTVALFCGSGTLVTMLHEAYMPSATEAALLAGGAGLVTWALLDERGGRRAVAGGALGFLLLGAVVTVRYTAVAVLAVLAATAVAWVLRRASPLRFRWLALWAAAGAVGPALSLVYDQLVYGAPLRTGYTQGVTFSVGAVARNLRTVPLGLLLGMPVALLAAAGVLWAVTNAVRARAARGGEAERSAADGSRGPGAAAGSPRRDLAVAGSLLAWWLAVWLMYLAYDWTTIVRPSMSYPLFSRFYLPALGALALLGALPLTRLPRRAAVPVAAGLLALGVAAGAYSISGDWLYGHGASPVTPRPGMPLPGAPGGMPPGAMPPGGPPPGTMPPGGMPSGAPPPGGMPSGAPS